MKHAKHSKHYYSIRRCSVGAASILIGVSLFGGVKTASADEIVSLSANTGKAVNTESFYSFDGWRMNTLPNIIEETVPDDVDFKSSQGASNSFTPSFSDIVKLAPSDLISSEVENKVVVSEVTSEVVKEVVAEYEVESNKEVVSEASSEAVSEVALELEAASHSEVKETESAVNVDKEVLSETTTTETQTVSQAVSTSEVQAESTSSITSTTSNQEAVAEQTKVVYTAPEAIAEKGRYTFKERRAVQSEAKKDSDILAYYDEGMSVTYDSVLEADNAQWISYIAYSGLRRYISLGDLIETVVKDEARSKVEDKVETPVDPKVEEAPVSTLAPRGKYAFTERLAIQTEARQASEIINYFDKGMTVNYDKVIDADNKQWISYINYSGRRMYVAIADLQQAATPSTVKETTEAVKTEETKQEIKTNQAPVTNPVKAEISKIETVVVSDTKEEIASKEEKGKQEVPTVRDERGTYKFDKRLAIQSTINLDGETLAYYDAGMSVNYDKVLEANGKQWISYISYSGARRYIAIGEISKTVTPSTEAKTSEVPSKTTSSTNNVVEKEQTAASVVTKTISASGTYKFDKLSAIQTDASTSSNIVTYFDKGMTVNYDKVIESDNKTWISYVSYAGQRMYVAVDGVKASAPTTSKQAPAPTTTASQSQSVQTPSAPKLADRGTYTFTERRYVQDSTSSSDFLFYYNEGEKVNYDQVIQKDGKTWISYISYSGTRRYIQVA